jgi:hypothetical protein
MVSVEKWTNYFQKFHGSNPSCVFAHTKRDSRKNVQLIRQGLKPGILRKIVF